MLILYFKESFGVTIGITALLFFNSFINFFNKFIEKFGLAASCIKTLLGLYLLIYLRAIIDDNDLSLPPFITAIFFEYFFLICLGLLTTKIIFLNNFDLIAFSSECSNNSLFLYKKYLVLNTDGKITLDELLDSVDEVKEKAEEAKEEIEKIEKTLDSHNVAELKEKLKEAGLSVKGKKADLVARLEAHMGEA